MKLSKAQAEVYENAKKQVERARENSFREWCKNKWLGDLYEKSANDEKWRAKLEKEYNENKSGVAEVHCNSKTLYALENFGLIEIIHDSKNDDDFGYDKIKVLEH